MRRERKRERYCSLKRKCLGKCIRAAKEAVCKTVLAKADAWVRVPPSPLNAVVAQLAEQVPFKHEVVGSIPTGGTAGFKL